MSVPNEITIEGSEWGSIAINQNQEVVMLKPGIISFDAIQFEKAIVQSGNRNFFDPKLPTNIHLGHPISVPTILFGEKQFVKLTPIAMAPIQEVSFRKEGWFENENGDMIKAEYVKMHTDGIPIFRNTGLDDTEGSDDPSGDGDIEKPKSVRNSNSDDINNI